MRIFVTRLSSWALAIALGVGVAVNAKRHSNTRPSPPTRSR